MLSQSCQMFGTNHCFGFLQLLLFCFEAGHIRVSRWWRAYAITVNLNVTIAQTLFLHAEPLTTPFGSFGGEAVLVSPGRTVAVGHFDPVGHEEFLHFTQPCFILVPICRFLPLCIGSSVR